MKTPAGEPAIAVVGLHKSYGDTPVLKGVDLTILPATVFALLGPNGAGKTTVVHILSTLLKPDAGTVRVDGYSLINEADKIRASIGVTGQFSAVDKLLTGAENLMLMARLRHLGAVEGRRRVDELLRQFDLLDAADKPISTYSGGMQRRLDLAMTLVGDPHIIFLDEPTTGLDPRSRKAVWSIIRNLVAGGVTIFLTTQYLDEADELADHIALLDGGRIVAEGTPNELKQRISGGHLTLHFTGTDDLDRASTAFDGATRDDAALALKIQSDGGVRSLRTVLDRLDAIGVEPDCLEAHTPDLDDVFFAFTGHTTKDPR